MAKTAENKTSQKTMPAAAAQLFVETMQAATAEFMKFTWLRVALILGFLAIFNVAATAISNRVLIEAEVPPSYRHLDELGLKSLTERVLDLKGVGPDTILIMGDCIAFGHGVKLPFSSHMNIPGRNILNISMQSMKPYLMTSVLGAARERGVEDVIIQLHPFENYAYDQISWEKFNEDFPVANLPDGAQLPTGDKLLEQSQRHWFESTIRRQLFTPKDYLFKHPDWGYRWVGLSTYLRFHILNNIPLYRDRYLVDYAGPKLSFFSSRTNRADSFRGQLSQERQIEILKSKTSFWKLFDLSEDDTYRDRIMKSSAPARQAAYMDHAGMNATFLLAPTFMDKMVKHTLLEEEDFQIMRSVLRDSVVQYGADFIDLLDDPELGENMHHYDNLTVVGHQILGERLSAMLADKGKE
jgi:hypothetical protein